MLLKKSSMKQALSVPEKAQQTSKGSTHELAIQPTSITVQLIVQPPSPKRSMRRPAIRALGLDSAWPGRISIQASQPSRRSEAHRRRSMARRPRRRRPRRLDRQRRPRPRYRRVRAGARVIE